MLERTLARTRAEEGFRPYVYDDATGEPIVPGYTVIGHPTLWNGICVEKGRVPILPTGLPDQISEFVLQTKWAGLLASRPWIAGLADDVQSALAEMAYIMGVGGVLKFTGMLGALARGDRETAAGQALDSEWARHPKTGPRAQRIATLIRGRS